MYQIDFVKSLNLKVGETWRGDCQFCGGKNVFTATNTDGKVVWNCFRADCNVKGTWNRPYTVEELSSLWLKNKNVARPFQVPERFVPLSNSETAMAYARANGIIDAYVQQRAEIKYDPAQMRVVFLIKHDNKIVGAIGRAVSGHIVPKWFVYDSQSLEYPFICKCPDTDAASAIVVEDAASACAVSPIGHGIALLGSSWRDEYIPPIMALQPKVLILALDKDAAKKSIDMQRKMSYYVDTRILLLKDDLKYLKVEEISEKVRSVL